MAETLSGTKVVPSACQLCIACCGINLHVQEGRVVKVEGMKEHPMNRGRLCPKGNAIPDLVNHPDRLQYPMKRQGSSWQRITWDEAMDTIVAKLQETKRDYGAKSVAVCLGMVFLTQARANIELIRRFTDVYGTPNVFSVDSMCFRLRLLSYILTLGRWAVSDLPNSRCIIAWGHNPDASSPPRAWWMIPEAVKNGAKVIVIDPRRIPLARKADIHARPRPGSDTALALGMMNVIIAEGLHDKDFVDRWTVGFDKLAEMVKEYPPSAVEKITWVPAQTIVDMARLFATTKPACIIQGWDTLDQKNSGVNNARAIAILLAITGNFDVAGGLTTPPPFHLRPIRLLDKTDGMPLGIDRFPLHYSVLGRLFGEGQGMVLPEVMLKSEPYPVKAMIVAGSNLLMSWPNSRKMEAALKKLDFLVVMDQFMGETAKLADIVLPAATFAERTEPNDIYVSMGIPWVQMRQKAVQVGECWPDIKFWLELANRMGYQEFFPWKNEIDAYDDLMQSTGISVKNLRDNPAGMYYGSVGYRNYEAHGVRTPSGKVEIYSETLAKMGQDPLPVHREPAESPVSSPELAARYPLVLTTGARVIEYVHSQLRQVERLRRLRPDPEAEMHPETAARYGIRDKDRIKVESQRGSIQLLARVTEDIIPGVVSVAHGWHEANVNILTDETPADPVGGNPALKALLCRVEKA
ncbi:MAG: molybdopterin-dependent oxidoreductase [Chloroflexi bacterium]|nr:molybdopterin-dependent oxidoreductase [Chloroflexota bacterium]